MHARAFCFSIGAMNMIDVLRTTSVSLTRYIQDHESILRKKSRMLHHFAISASRANSELTLFLSYALSVRP